MFTKFSTSLALVKIAFSYIKEEGELFVYALLSFFSSALILASFIVTDIFYIDTLDSLPNDQKQLITYAIMFFCYLVLYFITFFFNTAVITSVKRKLNREENSFGDGMRDSVKHLGKIFQWAMISATVSLILRIIESKFKEDSIIGSIIVRILGGAWSIMTFFAFPMMILEDKGPIEAIKDSSATFKKTWGELAILNVGSSFFYGVLIVLVVISSIGLMTLVNPFVGIVLLVVSVVFLGILNGLTDVIVTTLLLHYISSGKLPEDENERLAFASIAKV